MGNRRKAREYALQSLYMYESVRVPIEELLQIKWIEKEIPDEIRDFTSNLIEGSIKNIDYIDSLIIEYARNWKFERISVIDKSILRISIYALIYIDDVPSAVTINEGIELAKKYGDEGSGQFINGILDTIKNKKQKGQGDP